MDEITEMITRVVAERDALREELQKWQNSANERAANHLAALKECDILRDDVTALRKALASALDWLENAPINYANGNVHDGMDEGDVLGGRYHEKLTAQLRAALNMDKVVREFPVGEFANNDHQ